jgi:hypothetical protein
LPSNQFQKLIEKGDLKVINSNNKLSSFVCEKLKYASKNDYIEASRRYQIIAPYLQAE